MRCILVFSVLFTVACATAPRNATLDLSPPEGPVALLFPWRFDVPDACYQQALQGEAEPDCVMNADEDIESWHSGTLLVPLGCYDPQARALREADACPRAVGNAIAPTGSVYTLGPVLYSFCEADGSSARGYLIESEDAETEALYATWPETATSRALALVDEEPEDGEANIPASVRGRVETFVFEAFDSHTPLQVVQAEALDLDGDGRMEHLVSVLIPDTFPEYIYSGLLLVRDDTVIELDRSDIDVFAILAVSDLDGDGRLEVLTAADYYEGIYFGFWTLEADGSLRRLGGVGCGA